MDKMKFKLAKTLIAVCLSFIIVVPLNATDYYVDDDAGPSGDGSFENPFDTIMDGLNAAYAGDNVIVRAGTYDETISTVRSGSGESSRITLKAYNDETVTIIKPGSSSIHLVDDSYITFRDLIFDGNEYVSDIIQVNLGGDYFKIIGCEVKDTEREGIQIQDVTDILVDSCVVHHCITGSFSQQADAHGIRGDNISNLTVRNTEIYYVSGDAMQTSPNYEPWMNVVVEDCHFWTGPLPAPFAGYQQGETPGENAYDTKQDESNNRSTLYIKRCTFNGWINTPITNAAALNMKYHIDVKIDRCVFYNNEIGLRARGPVSYGGAWITMTNCIFYDHNRGVRHEDNIGTDLKIYNCTFGADITTFFQAASSSNPLDVKNCGFLGTKPSEASDESNLSLSSSDFVDVNNDNYHLTETSNAKDAGITISSVTEDFDGVSRPQGDYYDVGAYEYPSGSTQYTLTVYTVGSGSVDLDPYGGTYNENTVVTLTADPEIKWEFDSWSGDLSGTSNPETILMDSDKTVTATFEESDEPIDDVADSDIDVAGTVTGSYTDTQASDDSYESIEEIESKGKPSSRYSYLEHKWTINVTGWNSVTFYVEAYHSANSEGDDFVFAYSTDDNSYTNMVTVTKTADNDTYQSYELPSSLSGTVYIRVKDTDQTGGNTTLDKIFVDHMYIRSANAKRLIPMESAEVILPAEIRLYRNYPNPFNPSTTICYSLPQSGHVKLAVYDMRGRLVSTLVDVVQNAGVYTRVWEAFDSQGNQLPSGMYICRFQIGSRVETMKMVLMR